MTVRARFGRAASLMAAMMATSAPALAQTPGAHRWELGVVMPVVRFVDFDTSIEASRQERPALKKFPLATWTEVGLGVRLGFRVRERLWIEAEGDAFVGNRETPYVSEGLRLLYATGRTKLQLLVGPVCRQRLGPIVLFAKVRPGWIIFQDFSSIIGISRGEQADLIASLTVPATFLAVDLGGGAELPIHRRLLARFDIGDTIVRYRASPEHLNPRFSRHHLQFGAGVGWRF